MLAADKVENTAGKVTVSLPTADGKIERFAVNSFPVMDEALANQYQLGSYVGVGIDDPSKYVRFSVAPNDFQSMMINDGKYEFIEPATSSKSFYSIKGKSSKEGHAFLCSTTESPELRAKMKSLQKQSDRTAFARAGNKKFHTLRLALSTTAEYTNYFGGVAGALTQMNATLTRVNGVFEQEFNLHMNMINAPGIIFTNASTDPYSNASAMDNWNLQLMNTLHGGSYGVTDASFDIGHLFGATGGGGNAGCLECVCSNDTSTEVYQGVTCPINYKGSAYTSPADGVPKGDSFDIDYVAHEFGHQLGGSHNHSEYENYKNKEVEPGTGSTIMGYAGLWGANSDVQAHSDPYFSHTSIEQVQIHLAAMSCDVETNIANNPPVVTAMPTAYTIPKSTAFVLTANATDPDGDALTYTWEQSDPSKLSSGITKSNLGNTASGGSFRSLIPTSSPTRFFPRLATVLGGAVKNTTNWEATSTVARTTNFTVTVRDNKPGGQAQTAAATQRVIVGSANAFTVNSIPTLIAGGNSNITWVVSGTNVSPYNATNVKIDFTSDAGATWTTLVASVPNSGTASVSIPESLVGKTGHIRVSAIGNVFYAVKPATVSSTLAVSDLNNNLSSIVNM